MNVLRELRKFKRKSVIAKIRILILLGVLLVGSTYAWFIYNLEPPKISGISAGLLEWDVEYSIDSNVIEDEEFTFAIDEFYPGMTEFEKNIIIRNKTATSSTITLEVTSVKLFGEEIIDTLKTTDNIIAAGQGQTIFATENYPFKAGFSYDKNVISGTYVDDTTTPDATAKVRLYANWTYKRTTATKSEADNDELDTYYGEKAYEYYNSNEDEESTLIITIKLSTGRKPNS